MKRPPSILFRLIWRVGAIVALTAALAALVVTFEFRSRVDDLRDRSLRKQAEDIAQYVSAGEDGKLRLDLPDAYRDFYLNSAVQYIYFGSVEQSVFSVVDARGKLLFASFGHGSALAEVDAADRQPISYFSFLRRKDRRRYFGASMRVDGFADPIWVQVAQGPGTTNSVVDSMLEGVAFRWGWWVLPFVVILMGVVYATVRSGLRPLLEASRYAENISPENMDIRLPEAGMPREVLPLIGAVNSGLDRLEKGFDVQRAFTTDAAHQLRTPLAILQTRLSTMAKNEQTEALTNDVRRIGRLVSQLLKIVQFDTLTVADEEAADLRAISVEVVTMLAPWALEQGKSMQVNGFDGPVWVRGNADALVHAVRNLAENALEYTAPNDTVVIEVMERGAVKVMDNGPGIDPQHRELVFQRFWRADQRRGSGSGLGLAIVARTLEAHGGSIEITDMPGGGTVMTAHLESQFLGNGNHSHTTRQAAS
ncbi:MAG: sensor histidine kinase [Hyphomicrobiales bacterium]|nr:sensor histidine kinase [Hyphomicrobiales bacterium]